MASLSRPNIEHSLQKKGFRYSESGDRMYYFFHNGLKTSVRTKVSYGSDKDVSPHLLSAMKRQMMLRTPKQLRDFVDCRLSLDDYIDILRGRGVL